MAGTDETVPLTVVPAAEAEVICGLLRSEGIRCLHRPMTPDTAIGTGGGFGEWREIRVLEADLAAARELVEPRAEDAGS
jgi:hypothetical protein